MGDMRAMRENNGPAPKPKPKYRAMLYGESRADGLSVFVWTLGDGQSQVSEEIDSDKFWVDTLRLNSMVPLASGWQ